MPDGKCIPSHVSRLLKASTTLDVGRGAVVGIYKN